MEQNERMVRHILKTYKETRNSFEEWLIKFTDIYCNGSYRNYVHYKLRSLERIYRHIQNTLHEYEPNDTTKDERYASETKYRNKFMSRNYA